MALYPLAVFTVMVAVPFFLAVTLPLLVTGATLFLDDLYVSGVPCLDDGVRVAFRVYDLPTFRVLDVALREIAVV